MNKQNKIAAVYQILCLSTGVRYIGETNNFSRRRTEHIKDLQNGTHLNRHLQYSWKKYGQDLFVIEVIWCVPDDSACVLNAVQISHLTRRMEATILCALMDMDITVFNIRPVDHWSDCSPSLNPDVVKKQQLTISTDASKLKRSLSSKASWALPGEKERRTETIRAAAKDPKNIESLKLGIATRNSDPGYMEKLSAGIKKRWADPMHAQLHSKRMLEIARRPDVMANKSASVAKGWLKQSGKEARSGSNHFAARQVKCIETGVTYSTVSEASRSLGFAIGTVRNAITRGHKCGGFTWQYV